MSSESLVRTPTIAVGTDFSPSAEAAVAWGCELADALHGRLRLVHVLTLPSQVASYLPASGDYSQELQAAAMGRLEKAAQGLGEVDLDLRIGTPSQGLLEMIEERQPEVLIVGSRGLSGLSHLLLGSTAERVVQRASCPVLTVHADSSPVPLRTVVVPTDFSADAESAVHQARHLFHGAGDTLRVVLVHIFSLPVEYTAYGTVPTAFRNLGQVAARANRQLEETADKLRAEGYQVETECREGASASGILELADEFDADLIAMGTRGLTGMAHLLLGSTAERVVQKAPCPVLTVRAPGD
ncbi:MAG: universal stress protein [Acidobacteriota bacterium]